MNKEPSVSVGEALGQYASNPTTPKVVGFPIKCQDDREFTCSSVENRIKGQFEQWCRGNAVAQITQMEMMGIHQEEVRGYRSALMVDLSAGKYTWELTVTRDEEDQAADSAGAAIRTALSDILGMKKLLFLCLRRCHPKISQSEVNKLFNQEPRQCTLAINWALGNVKSPVPPKEAGEQEQEQTTATTLPKAEPEPPTLDD